MEIKQRNQTDLVWFFFWIFSCGDQKEPLTQETSSVEPSGGSALTPVVHADRLFNLSDH